MKLIIGYGNPLRTDDGIGAIVAEALGGTSFHQLEPELAEPISRARHVTFIDACLGETVGEIKYQELVPLSSQSMSHVSNPASILYLAQELYATVPPALLITITGASFEMGDKLSATLAVLLPRLIPQVQSIIQSHDKA